MVPKALGLTLLSALQNRDHHEQCKDYCPFGTLTIEYAPTRVVVEHPFRITGYFATNGPITLAPDVVATITGAPGVIDTVVTFDNTECLNATITVCPTTHGKTTHVTTVVTTDHHGSSTTGTESTTESTTTTHPTSTHTTTTWGHMNSTTSGSTTSHSTTDSTTTTSTSTTDSTKTTSTSTTDSSTTKSTSTTDSSTTTSTSCTDSTTSTTSTSCTDSTTSTTSTSCTDSTTSTTTSCTDTTTSTSTSCTDSTTTTSTSCTDSTTTTSTSCTDSTTSTTTSCTDSTTTSTTTSCTDSTTSTTTSCTDSTTTTTTSCTDTTTTPPYTTPWGSTTCVTHTPGPTPSACVTAVPEACESIGSLNGLDILPAMSPCMDSLGAFGVGNAALCMGTAAIGINKKGADVVDCLLDKLSTECICTLPADCLKLKHEKGTALLPGMALCLSALGPFGIGNGLTCLATAPITEFSTGDAIVDCLETALGVRSTTKPPSYGGGEVHCYPVGYPDEPVEPVEPDQYDRYHRNERTCSVSLPKDCTNLETLKVSDNLLTQLPLCVAAIGAYGVGNAAQCLVDTGLSSKTSGSSIINCLTTALEAHCPKQLPQACKSLATDADTQLVADIPLCIAALGPYAAGDALTCLTKPKGTSGLEVVTCLNAALGVVV